MTARQRARRTSPFYLASAFELFTPSKDLVLKYLEVFGLLYIVPFIFWIHSWVSTPAHGSFYWNRGTDANYSWTFPGGWNAAFIGFSIIWFLLAVVGGLISEVMLQRAQLDVANEKMPSIGRSWETFKEMWKPMVLLYLAMAVIFLVGFILLIVPGFFMIRRYMFAPYVMLEKKCGVKQALEESHQLGLANTGAVWGLIGVSVLIGLLGILPIIGSLVSFVAGFLYMVAPALRYEQLKKLAKV